MINCKYKICQWPECDKTCGLVPTGDYLVGTSEEEELIYHLQNEIIKKDKALAALNKAFHLLKNDIITEMKNASEQFMIETSEFEICCPLKYPDCGNDPGWRKHFDYEDWVEDGCPSECSFYAEGMGYYCPHYYDEDK